MSKNISIQCQGISKRYSRVRKHGDLRSSLTSLFAKSSDKNNFWALKDIDLTLEKGEVVGVIGKNGAGKSTLLKILSQITYPTTGRIEINGRLTSLLEVGTGFHPELTGKENIFLNGSLLGMNRQEIASKLDEIIDFSGIESFINMPVKHYSSGMYVRLAFAVAAHLNTEILIVDEILAVGDHEFQNKCLGKMEGYADSGRTVMLVSHNMPHITNLCTRAVMLESGSITFDDNPQTVIEKYLNNNKQALEVKSEDILEITSNKIITDNSIFTHTGDDLSIRLRFKEPHSTGIHVDIVIFDENNIDIFTSRVNYFFNIFNVEEGETIEASFPELLLNEGQYTFSIRLFHHGSLKHFYTKNIDVVVDKFNYYGGPELVHLNDKILLKHTWKRVKKNP